MGLVVDTFTADDWQQIRTIYLDGIMTGQATFEVDDPGWEQFDTTHLPECRLAARSQGQIIGWAALSPVSRRRVYNGVAEVSVYVAASHRGHGVGKALLAAVVAASERHSIWTLQGSTFPENTASLRMQEECGFRVVGRRERIGCHHGVWRDTLLTERRSQVVGVG
jgi:L-amino acid N-acyltransferase YncA